MRRIHKQLLCAGMLLVLNATARANNTQPYSYPEILVDDVKHILTAPVRWQARGTGTLVGESVVANNNPLRSGKVMQLHETTPESIGVRLTSNFQFKRDTISARLRRVLLCHP